MKYVGTSAPGPGVYSLPNMLRTQNDFNRSEVGRLFQKPIAQATELEKREKRPAPNQYQVIQTLSFVCVVGGGGRGCYYLYLGIIVKGHKYVEIYTHFNDDDFVHVWSDEDDGFQITFISELLVVQLLSFFRF